MSVIVSSIQRFEGTFHLFIFYFIYRTVYGTVHGIPVHICLVPRLLLERPVSIKDEREPALLAIQWNSEALV